MFLPPLSGCVPFILCCGGSVQLVFRGFFSEGVVAHITIDLLCSWEEVVLGSSYTAILNWLSTAVFFDENYPWPHLRLCVLLETAFILSESMQI